MSVALPPEVRHEDRRHEELHQRSAEEADELSEHTEQGMPELVDREVEAVEPAVVAGVENQEPAVHREHGGEGEARARSEEHTSELQSHSDLVCRLLLEKKKKKTNPTLHSTRESMPSPPSH